MARTQVINIRGNMKVRKTLLLLVLFGVVPQIFGQVLPKSEPDQVQLDGSIRFGTLPNGLTYYIKNLPDSGDKVDMRFYIKAGSNHEDSDQLNMAHFVEHMAFKSSDHFPEGIHNKQQMWEQLNMSQFDINGHARSEYTWYTFKAPAGKREAIDKGLLWFKDIAAGLHFKEDEVETERGVLIQEFISRSTDNLSKSRAQEILRTSFFPCYKNSSTLIEHHQNFNSERLKQFYKDWYRPDLMSVLVVGEIEDPDSVEKQIKNQFSDIRAHTDKREDPECQKLYMNRPSQFVVVEIDGDRMESIDEIQTKFYFRTFNFNKISSPKDRFQLRILTEIINGRLREQSNVYNSTFKGFLRHISNPPFLELTINSKNGDENKAFSKTFEILYQFHKYGALESEVKEAVQRKIEDMEKIKSDELRFWTEGIERHLLHGQSFTVREMDSFQSELLRYTAVQLKEFQNTFEFRNPDDIGMLIPVHLKSAFSEAEVRSWINSVDLKSLSPYFPPLVPARIIDQSKIDELKPKSILENRENEELELHELKLNNGVRVVLKSFMPTTGIYQDRIVLHAFKKSGAFSFSDEDYFSAINAPAVIKNSGIGELDKFELERYLGSTSLNLPLVNLYVRNLESGVKIDSKMEDFELMLQLVFLYFTEPRVSRAAFKDWRDGERALIQKGYSDARLVELGDKIRKIIGDYSGIIQGSEKLNGIEQTDIERGISIYRELFGDAQDFTFIITGDFALDSVLPLVNRYIGNLPKKNGPPISGGCINFNFLPQGPLLVQFEIEDINEKGNFIYRPFYIIPSLDTTNWKTRIEAEVLGRVIDLELWRLRFKKGYSLYSVGAEMNFNEVKQRYEISARIACTPEEYSFLRDEFKRIIMELRTGTFSEEVFKESLEELSVKYNPLGGSRSHKIVNEELYAHFRYGKPVIDAKIIQEYLKTLTPIDIQRAAQNFFIKENFYEFVMTN